jgi:hypothetical protein
MDNGTRDAPVTRREFHRALFLVWLYIALVLGNQLRGQTEWFTLLLFVCSVLMVVAHALTISGPRSAARKSSNEAEPVQSPKP